MTLLMMTLLIMTLLIMTLLIMTLLVLTLIIMTLLIMTLLVLTLIIMTLLIMTLLIMTLLIMTLFIMTLLISEHSSVSSQPIQVIYKKSQLISKVCYKFINVLSKIVISQVFISIVILSSYQLFFIHNIYFLLQNNLSLSGG
jgi:hypothetical protein